LGARNAAIFIGNSIFGDDQIGLIVGQTLRKRLEGAGFDVYVLERTGLALLDCLEGYEKAFVVDSFSSKRIPIGQVLTFSVEDFKLVKSAAPHFSGVPEAVQLMKELRMAVPNLSVIGINVSDPNTFADHISEELKPLAGTISEEVLRDIVVQPTGGVVPL
jgi:hydrogenase maturation protease